MKRSVLVLLAAVALVASSVSVLAGCKKDPRDVVIKEMEQHS